MKKIISSICIIFMLLSFSVTAFANDETFYFHETDEKLNSILYSANDEVLFSTARVIAYFNKDIKEQDVDFSKITYDLEQVGKIYHFKIEQALELYNSSDKLSFMKSVQPSFVFIRPLYNGKYIENSKGYFEEMFSRDTSDNKYYYMGYGYSMLDFWQTDIEEMNKRLVDEGFVGYDILYSFQVISREFLLVEKDGEIFTIFIPNDNDFDWKDDKRNNGSKTYEMLKEVTMKYQPFFDKRILTDSEMITMLTDYKDTIDNLPDEILPVAGSNVQSIAADNQKKELPIFEIILGSSFVILLALSLIIIKRKRRR